MYLRILWLKIIKKEKIKINNINIRKGILQGLLDSDGTIDYRNGKNLTYATASEVMANDVVDIVRSLGGVARIFHKKKKS